MYLVKASGVFLHKKCDIFMKKNDCILTIINVYRKISNKIVYIIRQNKKKFIY